MVTREIVPPESTVPLLRLWGPRGPGSKPGRVDRNHGEGDLANYHPIEGCEPPGAAYLLVDVERGEEFCNVRPEEASKVVRSRGRTQLTIDEGIALVTQVPQLLEKNKCFMLAGSRRSGIRGPAGAGACGSASVHRSSAGAGTAIRTPGWGWRRPDAARLAGRRRVISPTSRVIDDDSVTVTMVSPRRRARKLARGTRAIARESPE